MPVITQGFFLNSLIITLLFLLFLEPGTLRAQDNEEVITQFRRTVFKLQQEMLELKSQLDSQERELKAQKEELGLQVERLNRENADMRKHLLEMDSLILQMEDRLDASSLVKLGKQLENLRNFNQAMIMDNIIGSDQSEKILLDILNQPETSLPKDLLVLILAQQKKRLRQYDESLSYYSTLLAEFSDSIHFSQAIFEMAEVFGITEKKEQQLTLLAQLSSLSETDPFSKKARDRLKELGADDLFEEAAINPDATADVSPEEIETASADASPDIDTAVEAAVSSDATGDTALLTMPEDTGEPGSEDTTTDAEMVISSDATGDTASLTITEDTGESDPGDTTTDIEKEITDIINPVAPGQLPDTTSDTETVASDQAISDSTADNEKKEEPVVAEPPVTGEPGIIEEKEEEEENPIPEPDYAPNSQQPRQTE